ncbi:MAG: hypothetical protein IT365_20325 [Candidatus Hydrogenedentes bacterium]|nr:hypothetical protein [Candidatus Hydrogenedentota bacterium]
MRFAGLGVLCFAAFFFWANAQSAEDLIQQAGNAATDALRMEILERLAKTPGLDPGLARDATRMREEIQRWITEPKLYYFDQQVLKTDRYDFGIATDSPLFPLAEFYRARMLTWVTLEYGGYWSKEDARRAQFDKIRPLFEKSAQAFPENPLVKMYLGTPLPPETSYAPSDAAPAWANAQRESLERLADIVEWWIDHRMRSDGQYGGGWGDDCEMWRWWVPVLIAFDDPKITGAQERFSRALLAQDHMAGGYTSHVYDVEHTAEDSSDVLTPMMLLQPASGEWRGRALRLADLMETLWTGVNERGFLQFKSTYFSATEVDPSPQKACDTVYHPRAMQPTLLLWQRSGDERLQKLFTSWMDTWADAAAREERGKPAGVVPSAIHWPDGSIGGLGKDWWNPENHNKDPLYVFPSAMPLMTQTLMLTYHMTGDAKYLEPLRTMAAARLRYVEHPVADAPEGSAMWCAERLAAVTGTVAKYRLLTGSTDFDPLLMRDGNAYVRYRLDGNASRVAAALDTVAGALRINFPGYTSEVRYTDRVLRFPSIFGKNGMFLDGVEGISEPDTTLLYASVTGDPDNPQVFPLNAVRWRTPPREIAALVTNSGGDRFEAQLFHFGDAPRAMAAELYLLRNGKYDVVLEKMSAGGEATPLLQSSIEVNGPVSEVRFELPLQVLCALRVTVRKD